MGMGGLKASVVLGGWPVPRVQAALACRLRRYRLRGGKGVFIMSASSIWPVLSGPSRSLHARRARALGVFPPVVLLLCTSLLLALETPSKPFLEKNSLYLPSAGSLVHLSNNPPGQ